jgi:hypothetical protein
MSNVNCVCAKWGDQNSAIVRNLFHRRLRFCICSYVYTVFFLFIFFVIFHKSF